MESSKRSLKQSLINSRILPPLIPAALVLLLCFSGDQATSVPPDGNPQLGTLIKEIASEVNPEEAMQYMRRIYATDRWFTFPKFRETADYLQRTMKQNGFRDVELVEAPADGVSQFGFWTMPLAWDVKQAHLEIVRPAVSAKFRVLADYRQVPTSLGMWSGPTPPGGVTAEVVVLKATSPAAIDKENLKGKLVLTSTNPAGIKWQLARKGALGAINAFTENADLKDGRQWINAWGDKGWAFTKGNSPLLCFSITPRQAAFLRRLMARNSKVYVKAVVDSRTYSGTYPYVTGIIPGTEPEEEVLTLGHTSEQGAQDNATGVSAMLESLATLNRLINAGKLPRPRRSIRILAMGELYGSMHYLTMNPERTRRTVAAMCLDTPAGFYHLAGTEYTFYMDPHVAKSYVDAFILHVAATYLSSLRPPRPWHWRPFTPGTDSYLSDPTIGTPTVWSYSGSGIHTHHNSEDKPETVDPLSLRDLSVINAAFLYSLAAAGEPQANWLAQLALTRGEEEILSAAAPVLESISALQSGHELEQTLAEGLEKIDYQVDRESQAVLSVMRLVPEARRESVEHSLNSLRREVRRFGEEQSDRLRAAANQRGAELGIAQPVVPTSAGPDEKMAEASAIVVKRKRFGTIPLDELLPDQRDGYPSGAWDIVAITALYWCDGHRSIAEVIRLTRLELGPADFDFAGYFRFLEKHGYVEFLKR